jgi:2-phosphoglycerate kinase
MRLIFIYGAPAVGKLTVANELGRLTSFRVFDNHLSTDAVRPVLGIDTPAARRAVRAIRHAVIEEAAREGVDIIFTSVYLHPDDTEFVEEVCSLVEGHGGTVHLVQLTCAALEQEERVTAAHRVDRKIDSVEQLRYYMEHYDPVTPVEGRLSLSIDNTSLAPSDVARRIAEHFELPVQTGDAVPERSA